MARAYEARERLKLRGKLLVVGLATILGVPVGLADWTGWGAKGAFEPDTQRDVDDGWMRLDPDTAPTNAQPISRKVYFNAFMGHVVGYLPSVATGANPNSATLGTGVYSFPYSPKALLGVWKDCNDDGFIGLGDNALFEYRAEVLSALSGTSICPPEAVPTPVPSGWFPAHNDGVWVHEFLPIGYDNRDPAERIGKPDTNVFNIDDTGSRVWVDDDLPGAPPSGTCYTTAHPPGTYHSVGGVVNLTDCYTTGRTSQTGSAAFCSANLCGAWTQVNATRNPWGEETDGSYAYVWDCSAPIGPTVTAGSVRVQLHAPKTPAMGTGSPAGTANWTGSGLSPGCTPNADGSGAQPGQTLAHAPYTAESDNVNNEVGVKIQPEFTLSFIEGSRPGFPTPTAVVTNQLVPITGRTGQDDLGTGQLVYARGFWTTGTVRGVSRNPYVNRVSIEPAGASIETTYGFVSPAAVSRYLLELPKGTQTGQYGFEACGSSIGLSVVINGWQCNPDLWYPNGPDSVPREIFLGKDPNDPSRNYPIGQRIGAPYNVRDIDCYDHSANGLRELGVGYGTITGLPCPYATH